MTCGRFDLIYIQEYIQIDGTAAAPGAEERGAAPHQHGGEPSNGGEGQDNPADAGCAEIEPGYPEYHRRYSLQGKRGVQASR